MLDKCAFMFADTSLKQTPRVDPCLFYFFQLTLYKTDIFLKWTLRASYLNGVKPVNKTAF